MFKKILVVLPLAFILVISSLITVQASVSDYIIAKLMSAPKDQWGKGVECYRKAIGINPKDRQANRFLGDVLEKQYDRTGEMKYLDEAIAIYENAVKADPAYAAAASDLKRAKEKKGIKN